MRDKIVSEKDRNQEWQIQQDNKQERLLDRVWWQERQIAKKITYFATNALPGNACSLRHQALVLWDQRRPSPCRILFPRFDQRVRLQWRAPSLSTPSTCLRKSPPTGRCSDESTAAKRKFLRTTTLLSPENADRFSLYHGFRWLSSLKWQSNAHNRRYYKIHRMQMGWICAFWNENVHLKRLLVNTFDRVEICVISILG